MSKLSVTFAKNFLVLCNLMPLSGVMTFELSILSFLLNSILFDFT